MTYIKTQYKSILCTHKTTAYTLVHSPKHDYSMNSSNRLVDMAVLNSASGKHDHTWKVRNI